VDDIALLRRTVRRCTAVLVATVATLGVSLQHPSEAGVLVVIVLVSAVYLITEFIRVNPSSEASDDERSQTTTTEDT
jgi:hypothetical protein